MLAVQKVPINKSCKRAESGVGSGFSPRIDISQIKKTPNTAEDGLKLLYEGESPQVEYVSTLDPD